MSKPISENKPSVAGQQLEEDKKQHDKKGDNAKHETPQKADDGKDEVLNKENLPDASNESTGVIGSGQRQDSN
ncbi:hypothetical protein [Filimonas effusa]|uniref:Uncharacterized protein n=1 Tax=Filimonas effusa TaxID=2508721 RepID=A0A4Q1D5H7_9BACT|nr:hypothetical protein [Filimonas effusa]RXK83745.1 hypothetical protein ESB13_16850 [Filimonas effusa]